MILNLLRVSSSIIRCFSTTQYFPSSYNKCQEIGVQEDGKFQEKDTENNF